MFSATLRHRPFSISAHSGPVTFVLVLLYHQCALHLSPVRDTRFCFSTVLGEDFTSWHVARRGMDQIHNPNNLSSNQQLVSNSTRTHLGHGGAENMMRCITPPPL